MNTCLKRFGEKRQNVLCIAGSHNRGYHRKERSIPRLKVNQGVLVRVVLEAFFLLFGVYFKIWFVALEIAQSRRSAELPCS